MSFDICRDSSYSKVILSGSWIKVSSVQFSHSVVSDSANSWTTAGQASLSITNSQSLLKLISIEAVMPFNNLILRRPSLLLPSIFSSIRVFSNESALCIRWPKYWGFGFSIRLSNEYSGLISFRIDWFDLLAVQGTLKGLLQHHNLKASIHRYSAFFMAQLSHLYMTTAKTVALNVWIYYFKCLLRYIPMPSFKPRLLSILLICRSFFKPLFCILI